MTYTVLVIFQVSRKLKTLKNSIADFMKISQINYSSVDLFFVDSSWYYTAEIESFYEQKLRSWNTFLHFYSERMKLGNYFRVKIHDLEDRAASRSLSKLLRKGL